MNPWMHKTPDTTGDALPLPSGTTPAIVTDPEMQAPLPHRGPGEHVETKFCEMGPFHLFMFTQFGTLLCIFRFRFVTCSKF